MNAKSRLTISIAPDAFAMLETAASLEGESNSAIAERAIRFFCAEYAQHEVQVDLLERQTAAVRVKRAGRVIVSVRTDKRNTLAAVEASVTMSFQGRVDGTELAAALRQQRVPAKTRIQSGKPVLLSRAPLHIQIDAFTIGNATPKRLNELLQRAAVEVSRLRTIRFGDIARNRCRHCGSRIVSISIWAPGGVIEERESICLLGHASAPA